MKYLLAYNLGDKLYTKEFKWVYTLESFLKKLLEVKQLVSMNIQLNINNEKGENKK